MKKLIYQITAAIFLISCTKEINLDLANQSGKIIIDGSVTDLPGPYYVSITRSVAFTQTNEFPIVNDAVVVISSSDGNSDVLEYDATIGSYKTHNLVGKYGITYTLTVSTNGQQYTAQSTMPSLVNLDSLRPQVRDIANSKRYSVVPVFTDAPALGNYYRFKEYANGVLKKNYFNFSDNTNNGLVNTRGLQISVGTDPEDVSLGANITVEMQCIDQNVYTYYTALAQISSNNGLGGGVTPSNPPGNISNSGLGIFSAHTSQKKSFILK